MKAFTYKSFFIAFIILCNQKTQAQDPNWTINPPDFQYNMTFTAFLNVNGVTLTSPNDKVAAFVNGEIRGVSNVVYIASANKYVSFLSVYSNTNGETINFKIYNSAAETVVDVDKTKVFNIDEIVGGIFQSYSIASPALNENAVFNSFSFSGITAVSTDISSDKIDIVLPENTSLTSLQPLYETSTNSKVYLDRVLQESGTSSYDFTNPIIYEVLSEDESTLNEYEVTVSLAINTEPVTVSISSSESMNTNSVPVSLDITFSKDVSGFSTSDFILENAVISSFSVINSKEYNVEMIPLSQGIFTAQIPSGVAVGENNIQNEISNKIEFNYDILKPLITNISVDSDANSWWFLVTFSEDVVNVDELDFELKGMASSGLTISSISVLTANEYKVHISNSNTDMGVISLQLKSTNNIKDNAENTVVLSDFESYFLNFDNRFIGINSDWNTASNWSFNSVPTSTDNVRINNATNHPVIDATTGASVNNLTVDSSASLTINGGSLIVSGTSTGNITYNRNLATTNWYLVSSPVSGETIQNLISNHTFATGANPNIGLAPYDNTQADVNNRWDYQTLSSTGTVNTGQGYSVKLNTIGNISFTGSLNTSDVTIALTQGFEGGGDDFNLLGNPYTSYINSATFLTSNTSELTSQTVWLWNQTTDTYDTKVTADAFKLAPCQGFFVQANTTNIVTFAESTQSYEATDTFQRSSRPEVHLYLNDEENNSRYAKIYYIEGTTTGFDNGYDGELFGGVQNSFEIYSHLLTENENKKYQIQSLPNSNYESMIIPIGIKVATGKEITFSAETLNLPTDLKVFLEDKEENTFTRLDQANSEYTITISEDLDGVGRFYLHTSTSALTVEDVVLPAVHIYKSDNSTLKIVGLPQGSTTVRLFNVLGKQMLHTTFDEHTKDISLPNLVAGMYLVQIQTATGKLNKKIVL